MKHIDIQKLSDSELILLCNEPVLCKVRGKSPEIKSQVIAELSHARRSLFLFQVLYGHANQGIQNFFRQISYLVESLDLWAALQSAMRYFGDTEMLALIGRMKAAYEQADNSELLSELDAAYSKRIPESLKLIGAHIRNNPAEFL